MRTYMVLRLWNTLLWKPNDSLYHAAAKLNIPELIIE
jgi:hypothetical protein